MKKILLSVFSLVAFAVVSNAQAVTTLPAKVEQQPKKINKEEEKAKKEAQMLEAFAQAGLTEDEIKKAKAVMEEMNAKSKAVKNDATLDDAAKKAKLDELNKEKNEKLKAAMTEAKYKLYQKARKAQKEAAAVTEVKE